MSAQVLPALAVAALTDTTSGDRGVLVAARRGKTLHALLDTGRALTRTGRVRAASRPLCGRPPRRWRVTDVDGRRLCRTCERVLTLHVGPGSLLLASTWLTPEQLAATLVTARDQQTVSSTVTALLHAGHAGKTVTVNGQQMRLTALVAQTRSRLHKGHHLTDADISQFSYVKSAPARRFPRRVS